MTLRKTNSQHRATRAFAAALLLSLASVAAFAHEYEKGAIFVDHPWARITYSTVTPGAVYFEIENRGETEDRLLSARTEIAEAVEIHKSVHDEDGVVSMKMLKEGMTIPVGEKISFEEGAYHVMLIGLKKPLLEDDKFPLTLTFEKAGEIEVMIHVENRMAKGHGHH